MILPTLLQYIDKIARQHPLLNDTGRGDVYDNLNNKKNKYPYMNVDVQNSTTNGAVLTYQIYFVVADRLTVDRANEYTIKYDCEGILRTILNALGNTDNIKVENVELEYFTQQFADYLGGVYCTTTIEVPNNFGRCNWMGNINVTPQIVTIEPSTEKQTFLPQGGRMIAKVVANPVTAAIDENIRPENIRKNITILGVEGTAEAAPSGDKIKLGDGRIYTTDTERDTAIINNEFQGANYLVGVQMNKVPTIGQNGFYSCTNLEWFIGKSVTQTLGQSFNVCTKLKVWCVGKMTDMRPTTLGYGSSYKPNLRVVEVGQDTDINLPFGPWTATNVIAEGQTGVDELNFNIKTYIADRVADRTGGDALSITIGAALYDVLTDATKQAFVNKNWNVIRA